MVEEESAAEGAETDGLSWRDLAVARSLDSARLRAESRVQRFLDAAVELLTTGSGKDFTVQEVVERSGQSLRSFYQYFSGKHELLLALFEESVRSTSELLRQEIAHESAYYRLCRPTDKKKAVSLNNRPPIMAEFAQQLLTTHPKEAAQAFAPLVALFEELLQEAVSAKVVRADVRSGPIVGVVLEVIMFNAFSSTIGGLSLQLDEGNAAEELWKFVFQGIGAGPKS
jgi:AcrR family transcriptional regulator